MPARTRLYTVAAVLALASVGLRCTLDFDRYQTAGDGGGAEPDASVVTPGPDAGSDAGSDGAGALVDGPDAAAEAGPAEAAVDAPCVPSPACLTQATSCAMTCAQQDQRCTSGCHNMGCMNMCTSQQQSCGGQCITKCITCAQNAGCPASSACLTAGSP